MKTSRYYSTLIQLMLMGIALMSGCGYHRAGTANPLLTGIDTIAIPYFRNDTFEAGLESTFTRAFSDEFIESKRLRVVTLDSADVILRGTLKAFREEIISYNRDDKAMEYRVFVSMDLSLEQRQTGEILWKRKGLRHNEEYSVSTDIVVSETGKSIALEKIARDLARRVYESVIQGF